MYCITDNGDMQNTKKAVTDSRTVASVKEAQDSERIACHGDVSRHGAGCSRTVAGVKQFGNPKGDYYPRMESEKYAIYDQFGHIIEGNFNTREEAVTAIDPDWLNTYGPVWVNVHKNP